ncbi:conserved membrane hypothetical protein [Planktothrix serta PCC 8927]|uniref:Uncharacterized protein n=1 Tax=Planktothrix serta PCC 8927 TaxID=671068 RepID=A0A7Z9BLR2_9CYAN|nr:hypothetical protein [Planktothrix serta]VXD13416.1 conserved membrane hypothetical protein [Planktothrix serta PCC 8927]
MRSWRIWWQTLVFSTQYNPPQFVEVLMLLLGILLLFLWTLTDQWPYLVLCLSYVVGSSTSMLIREALIPSPHLQLTQALAILLLMLSVYTLIDLVF